MFGMGGPVVVACVEEGAHFVVAFLLELSGFFAELSHDYLHDVVDSWVHPIYYTG